MLEHPVVKAPAHAHVADRLRHAIRTGTLAPDDRLPSEPHLARALGVSRSTLREALHCLRDEGYVSSRRGATGGLFVSGRAAQRECTREQLLRRRLELEHLLEFRSVVEPRAAALAARRRSDADLGVIETALAVMRGCRDIPSFRQADTAFHSAIAAAAGNAYIERAVDETREGLFGLIDLADFDVLVSRSIPQHEAILKSIVGADANAAEEAMALHIASAREEVNEVIEATVGDELCGARTG
jgi:DNA-binding FadR family transcriptional regulator